MQENINWELILHRLNSIADGQKLTSNKLTLIEEKLTKLETMKHSVDNLNDWKHTMEQTVSLNDLKELREWKKEHDEIVSSTQLKKALGDVERLKIFKTQAMMIWVVVQAIILILIFLQNMNVM